MYRRRRRTPALPQFNDPGGIVYQPQAQCLANALQRERRHAGCPRSKDWPAEWDELPRIEAPLGLSLVGQY
jgi:hypothetical protein